ncbi:YbgA family protein [Streptococcus raffinosi]|uniref:YbgA family protein n=1 Tax=Streptococcus raffinosi TaxID=3053355 RepID=A0ABT7LUI2_9STRE|nr:MULTISPECIES: YbgA family protein [unclassified Streptococcus]MDL5044299.1 YbgA family protein [Streptococcus sp. VTCC 12812]MDM0095430.1 YbgA family protein [Streptococcus sp. VTCC 12813]
MTTINPRRQCERLWAANKYLVLSHSNKIYLEIRNYLKQDEVRLDQVQAYIDQALALPENPGQVVNAFQHIWGYFKKKATASEKEMFMAQLDSYAAGRIPQIHLVTSVRELLTKYPNRYLEESTLINGGSK